MDRVTHLQGEKLYFTNCQASVKGLVPWEINEPFNDFTVYSERSVCVWGGCDVGIGEWYIVLCVCVCTHAYQCGGGRGVGDGGSRERRVEEDTRVDIEQFVV